MKVIKHKGQKSYINVLSNKIEDCQTQSQNDKLN